MDVSLRFLEKAEDRWTAGLCSGGQKWSKFQKRIIRLEASLRAGREWWKFQKRIVRPEASP